MKEYHIKYKFIDNKIIIDDYNMMYKSLQFINIYKHIINELYKSQMLFIGINRYCEDVDEINIKDENILCIKENSNYYKFKLFIKMKKVKIIYRLL